MEKQFEIYIKNDSAVIAKYRGNQEYVEIPEFMDGKIVVRVGDYSFSEYRNLEEVELPVTVKEIGKHAFYNCRKLSKISITDHIYNIEDGAFKNCESLKQVNYRMLEGKTAGLKGLLTETNRELHVTMDYALEEKGNNRAKVIFPRYLHDYEENTSAKVINQVTYGAGVHYRECLSEKDIDYKRYDELFHYVMANDSKETACFIALYRLLYPYQLEQKANSQYREFLESQILFLTKQLLKEDDMEAIKELSSLSLYSAESLEHVIETAHDLNSIEGTRYFLQFKKDTYGTRKKVFEL